MPPTLLPLSVALLILGGAFYLLERLFPAVRDQRIWRRGSRTDLLYGLLIACLFSFSAGATASARAGSDGNAGRVDVRVQGVTAMEIVEILRSQCAAVSFIESPQQRKIDLDARHVPVADVLRQIAEQDPSYRAERIDGRDVLYPAKREFQARVRADIADRPRQEALEEYVARLAEQVPELRDLLPQVVFGYADAPVYVESVSLRREGRVIEHFVDLLGDNPRLYFKLGQAKSGLPTLEFASSEIVLATPSAQSTADGGEPDPLHRVPARRGRAAEESAAAMSQKP